MNDFEKEIIKILKKETKLKEINLEIPKQEFGDYAFPCFVLAKTLKKNPNEIAQDLAKKIKLSNLINKVEVKGPYLNFFCDKGKLADDVIKDVLKQKDKYGSQKEKKTVLVESPGPNTNKPLHLGHLRNMSLGISLSNIYKFIGCNVKDVDIINDRGIHICKSMLAYKKWGKGKKPNKKSDHFVGDYYVLFAQKVRENPKLEQEAQELLEKWENGDKEARELSKKMNKWAVDGMFETYKRFGRNIEKSYYESDTYLKGKKIVMDGLKKGIFEKDDGSIVVDLENEKLGKKVLIRANGTAVYITQDMALAGIRYKDYKMDKMIYVVGNEQIYHFKVLFELFKMLKFSFAKNCFHLAYGMVNLPEGKMKSREGKVVDADDLMDEMIELAKKEILKRHKGLSQKEIDKRSEQIGLGAIKFYILKHDPMKDMMYNPEESIKFEGETGPYAQYAHTRISSILSKGKVPVKVDYSLLKDELELKLISLLSKFPDKVDEAANNYKPSLIATYLIELSQTFNSFYVKLPVLKAEKDVREARLSLIMCVKQVLKNGLNLLGIEAPDRM